MTVLAVVAAVINRLFPVAPDQGSNSIIYDELDAFTKTLSLVQDILVAMLVFWLNARRELIGQVFNRMQQLWLR